MANDTMAPSGRLVSLDAFRGLTIAGMFVVLNHGIWSRKVIPDQLFHPEWHGFTITDTVLPFFIFIVGVALPFSFDKRLSLGETYAKQLWHAVRRTVLIIVFGLIIYINEVCCLTFNLWGALQIIACCYFFAFLTLHLKHRMQAIIIACILIAYYLMFILIPTPAGAGNPYVMGNNIGTLFDQWLLGQTHPAGYVTINIICGIPVCILGVMVGRLLKNDLPVNKKIAVLLIGGIVGVALGWALDAVMPINKKLWTSSFAIFVGGWSCLSFLLFYWIIDVKGYKKWAQPLVIYGLNPITIYVFNGLWKPWILNRWNFKSGEELITLKKAILSPLVDWFGPTAGSLTYTAIIVLFYWSICYWMYRKRIFLKL